MKGSTLRQSGHDVWKKTIQDGPLFSKSSVTTVPSFIITSKSGMTSPGEISADSSSFSFMHENIKTDNATAKDSL